MKMHAVETHVYVVFIFGHLHLLHPSCTGLREWELSGPFPDSNGKGKSIR